ncbi:hypothetical protein JYU34_011871 [Plutella xylostella]|uniref:Uncharacterized protein n=1 Tax=Plutella xylostella TaxID=51655 RepID=A0ABQ7QE97_PLUXY|nr:hypothetical protein JYU34_011871 [Plutella xylostella]
MAEKQDWEENTEHIEQCCENIQEHSESEAKCTENIEKYLGNRYVLVNSENFDEFLRFLGYGYLYRTAALRLKPSHVLSRNPDGSYTFAMDSILISTSITFKLAEQFIEKKPPDGVEVKTVITIEGNVMTQTQLEEGGRVTQIVRTFYTDKMISETTVEGWDKILIRTFVLVPQ